jgi:hypothetical protein
LAVCRLGREAGEGWPRGLAVAAVAAQVAVARCPHPVEGHRHGGCGQRGPGRDQGDLPSGHAACHDCKGGGREDRGHGWVRRGKGARAAGAFPLNAQKAPAAQGLLMAGWRRASVPIGSPQDGSSGPTGRGLPAL